MIEPTAWWGMAAASNSTDRTSDHSNSALAFVPPVSRTSHEVISSLRFSSTSAALRITPARTLGVWPAQSA